MKFKNTLKAFVLCVLTLLPELYVFANEQITVGVFPRRNSTATVKMFSPMMKYVEQETGLSIRLETAKNFSEFWSRVKQGRYDIVHYNQLHYILSQKFGYKVFLKNEEFGRSLISSGLLVRKDSGINSISDLKGKSIIFGGGKLALIANVGNRLYLQENNLAESDYRSLYARNPPNAALAVFFKRADAAGVGSVVLDIPGIRKKINTDELKFLDLPAAQPHLPWAYSSNVTNVDSNKIANALKKLHLSEKGKKILKKAGLTKIISANDREYNQTRIIYQQYLDYTDK